MDIPGSSAEYEKRLGILTVSIENKIPNDLESDSDSFECRLDRDWDALQELDQTKGNGRVFQGTWAANCPVTAVKDEFRIDWVLHKEFKILSVAARQRK